ncbi:MAG: transcriptional regulator [Desulfobacterales bacterium]
MDGTVRQQIASLLREGFHDALDISKAVGISEKEVYGHLEHIRRSAAAAGEQMVVEPAACGGCGFRFEDRRRLTRPGRCPKCRQGRVSRPAFHIRPL